MLLKYHESALANPPGAGLVTRRSNPLTDEGVGTRSPTWIVTYYEQLAFAFPVYQVPIDVVQLGRLLPQLTPGHLNSWVDWSNVS